jgi:hypothetical protein
MKKIGIMPAGGKARRWNGYPKEMLPIGASWTLLDRMILLQQRALVDQIYLVSSQAKYDLHKWWINDHRKWPNVSILLADSVQDSILNGINANGEADFIFSMPDTLTDIPLFPEELEAPLVLGAFHTTQSHRFGMIRGDGIVDKEEGPDGEAWGAFMFNNEVARFWRRNAPFVDHTAMLNAAMNAYDWTTWRIEKYLDVASFKDYLKVFGG